MDAAWVLRGATWAAWMLRGGACCDEPAYAV